MKVDINAPNRLKIARIKMSKTCPNHETNKTWPMVRLGDVCVEIKDRIHSSKIAVGEYVTTDNMVKDRGGIVQAEYVPSDVGLVEYHKGDVLIANIRPYLKKIWLADHDGGCSSDVVVFRRNTDGLSSEYLYSVLSQDAYFEYVMQKPRGTKMPRGDRDWMKEFRFPLPPLPVQREIVARLERELATVEKMKKGFEALAETAKQELKAELKEVFEGLKSGGAEMRRLGEISKISYGFTAKAIPDIGDGSPKYLRITDIQGRSVEWGSVPVCNCSNLEEYRLKEGDIVFARTGATTGKSFLITGDIPLSVYASYLIRVQIVNFKTINPWFLWYSFDTPDYWASIQSGMVGAAQGGFNSKKLASIELPLPPLADQREVVARLDAAKARAEKLEAKAREGVAVCETMRKAILKEAFE